MFGSLLKGIFFLIVSGFCAFGVIYLTGLSGSLTLRINGSELSVSVLVALGVLTLTFLVLIIGFGILNLFVALVRFLSGDETAISRYFNRTRNDKGNKALLNALISFYEGDSANALLQSGRAKQLLRNNSLSLLINAQIAQKSGDSKLVVANYKKLLQQKETRLVALSGIVSEKIKNGDYETALKLTKKSFQLNPKNINNINTLFNLQISEKDWSGARKTLNIKKKFEKMERKVFLRQDSMLMFEEARETRSKGHIKESLDLVLAAVRQNPSFVVALAFLTDLELMSGSRKRIEKLLQKGWGLYPHPDIAKSYAKLVEEETPEDRKTRFKVLINMKRDFAQSKILEAELCLALNDFATAKKIILEVVKTDPDNYLLTLMAAAERGSGSPDSVVHEWLAKAAYAPKSKAWICKNCNFQTEWVCVCPKCECFDSIEWTRPQDYSQNDLDQIQIPFILKTDERNGLSTDGEFLESEDSDSPSTSTGKDKFQPKLETNIVKKAREIN